MGDDVSETCMFARDVECIHRPLVANPVFARESLTNKADACIKVTAKDRSAVPTFYADDQLTSSQLQCAHIKHVAADHDDPFIILRVEQRLYHGWLALS